MFEIDYSFNILLRVSDYLLNFESNLFLTKDDYFLVVTN